jgi:replicative DNA helicase
MSTAERTDRGHAPARVSAEILDRLPPQNLEAERGVLGSLLLVPDLCDEVALIIRPDDFYADANRLLFESILEMHNAGQRVDATLLVEKLRTKGQFEAVGGMAYLAEVAQSVPYAANATYYAKIVRDKATLRHLILASTETLRDAYDGSQEPDSLLTDAERRIFSLHDLRTHDQVTDIGSLLVETFARIDARLEKGDASGVPSFFTDLDTMTGGLHNSELVILAARPSMGKTALAMNIAENAAIKGKQPTLFVSLEMSRYELAQRMLCSQGRIDASKFRSGFLSGDDRKNLVKASTKLGQAPLFIDDSPARTVTEIGACARRLRRKHDIRMLVIDYLQLLQPDDPRDPRQEQVAKIARRLKQLARELEIPVLCLAQLNRQVEAGKEGHRPKLAHLRESGAIEQDADVVMFIHREEYYHTRDEAQEMGIVGQAEVIVAKQRNGPTGEVKLAWFDKFTRFENLSEKPYEEFSDLQEDF